MNDSLGDRMKDFYEGRSKTFLARRTPVIIRIDGKAFHTFCKRFERPYDHFLNTALNKVALHLCQNIQSVKFAERHFDEISLLLTDYDNFQTDAYFDYNVQKICSVAASMATAEFCRQLAKTSFKPRHNGDWIDKEYIGWEESWPCFDARCFNIPEAEVENYFWWRMLDGTRNSISMQAQSKFSHRELQGKNSNDMQEMLFQEHGINWGNLPQGQKVGFVFKKIDHKGSRVWVEEGSPSKRTGLTGFMKDIKFRMADCGENPNNTETVVEEKPVESDASSSEERICAIQQDLEKRGVFLQLVIASDKDGMLQVIGYGEGGTVNFLSQETACVKVYSGEFNSRMMQEIGSFSMPKQEDKFWENRRKEKALETQNKSSEPKKKGFWGKLLK
jgi:tRNA(His) 5'-end guanylyltransferase